MKIKSRVFVSFILFNIYPCYSKGKQRNFYQNTDFLRSDESQPKAEVRNRSRRHQQNFNTTDFLETTRLSQNSTNLLIDGLCKPRDTLRRTFQNPMGNYSLILDAQDGDVTFPTNSYNFRYYTDLSFQIFNRTLTNITETSKIIFRGVFNNVTNQTTFAYGNNEKDGIIASIYTGNQLDQMISLNLPTAHHHIQDYKKRNQILTPLFPAYTLHSTHTIFRPLQSSASSSLFNLPESYQTYSNGLKIGGGIGFIGGVTITAFVLYFVKKCYDYCKSNKPKVKKRRTKGNKKETIRIYNPSILATQP